MPSTPMAQGNTVAIFDLQRFAEEPPVTPPEPVQDPVTPPEAEIPPAAETPPEPPTEPPEEDKPPVVPDKYEITLPESMKDMAIDTAALEAFTPIAQKLKLTNEQANELAVIHATAIRQQYKAISERVDAEYKEAVESIKKSPDLGGANYDKNVGAINKLFADFGGTEMQKHAEDAGVYANPKLFGFLLNVAKQAGPGRYFAGAADSAFCIAAAIAIAIIYFYTRCLRSTALVVACSVVAVVWQLGLVAFFGFELDPFSILVPFLIFAIGVSHGAQKMNGIMQDIGRGTHRLVAARYTFRRLFLAGMTALLADAVGFAVLMLIDIPVIKDLALTASLGVAVLIFTNLILLPVLLSYTGFSDRAA